jgi:SAM-dependent methyltransferase
LALLQGKGAGFVAGVDFSPPAIAAARRLADELSIGEDRACFVLSNVYDAPAVYPRGGEFDLAFVTWGAINWLPDIRAWAKVVSYYLKPGTGRLYLAEGHPAALVFDDLRRSADNGLPGFLVPYFGPHDVPLVFDSDRDYSDPEARLVHTRTYEWTHPLSLILEALQGAGLQLEFLHEHDAVPWRMFEILREDPDGMFRWPSERWLPLSFSLQARKL